MAKIEKNETHNTALVLEVDHIKKGKMHQTNGWKDKEDQTTKCE